ncbi:WD40-repeat-containing domain protein [Butyriboletus roseoflavus]|nr:WD40-repeat-containing domain protein [Butyriboletus roseoflavus]
MSSTNTNPTTIVLETSGSREVAAVVFHPDRKHLLAGGRDGIRRWRLADGQKVGMQTGVQLRTVSVSKDHKWIVCGSRDAGASVWDAEIHEKVVDVEGTNWTYTVDVSPDSSRFATGTGYPDKKASIWSITSGKRLVGPLKHGSGVTGIRFSPTGEHIATSCHGGSVRIFDSYNGDQLIDIKTISPAAISIVPLAWSNDGQQIFTVSDDQTIKSFAVSTGSQLTQSTILAGGSDRSIALAPNGKFIATYAGHSILFLDASTLSLVVPAIQNRAVIFSIAISPNGSYLATGQGSGRLNVRNLDSILPDSYGPFHASTREEQQHDELPSTSTDHDNKPSGSGPDEPGKSGQLKVETRNKDDDGDFLEDEVPTNTPAAQFDYDESLSHSPSSSVHLREDEVLPLSASDAIPHSSETHPVENLDTPNSSHGIPMLKGWVPTRTRKRNEATSHKPDRVPGTSGQPVDRRSRSQSPPRVGTTSVGPSWMAAGQRVRVSALP